MIWILVILLIFSTAGCGFCFVRLRRSEQARRASQAFAQSLLENHERERKRIAEELHAGLGQNLLVMKNRAELGLREAVTPASAQQFEGISKVCSVAIEEARRTAHDLGPRHLEQLGLTEALDAMVDRVAAGTQIKFERKLEAIDDLFPKESSTNIYRIVQEALNNILKHGRASGASVRINRDVRHVHLIVQDNGVGFDREKINGHRHNGGLGLAVIAERVRILGGKLEITGGPGQGTLLAVTIPTGGKEIH
jgi:signal transduction histidine kinase